jgi:flavin-dependent dehydrogenase
MLIDAAIANGCHFMKAKVDSVSEGTVIISGQKNIEGKFIIGADGAIGVTRNSLGIKTDKREFSGSLETETNISNLKTHKNIPQIHFGHTPYGYGWVFPREDLAVIGIGGLTRKTSLPGAMSSLLDTVVSDKTLTGQIEGFPIPTHNFVKKPGRGRILLVGDAAGLIDPFTGEGIYAAALSGKIAAESILVGYNPAAEYNSTISKKLHSSIKHAKIVRRFFFHPKLFPLFMKKMHQKEEYGHHFFELLSGQLNYSDFARRIFTVRRAFLMMGILAKP